MSPNVIIMYIFTKLLCLGQVLSRVKLFEFRVFLLQDMLPNQDERTQFANSWIGKRYTSAFPMMVTIMLITSHE